jgi:hypothetical protein
MLIAKGDKWSLISDSLPSKGNAGNPPITVQELIEMFSTYSILFLVGSLLLYPTSMYLRVFFTALTTGFCYGVASIVTGYFDRCGWQKVGSLGDRKKS